MRWCGRSAQPFHSLIPPRAVVNLACWRASPLGLTPNPTPRPNLIQNLACGVLEGKPAAEADEPIEPIDTASLVSKLADASAGEPTSIEQLQMPARQTPAVARAAQAGQHGQGLGSAPARLVSLLRARLAAQGGSALPRERPAHWAPRHGLGCSSHPPPKPPIAPPLALQAGRVLVSEVMSKAGPPHDAQMQEAATVIETAPPDGGQSEGAPRTRKQRRR